MGENGYVKITFEDVKIAENFFENDKHLDEFLSQVCRYYIGFETTFKHKNVKKYFETYKKVMDRVIKSRSTGSIGGNKRVENQQLANKALEGSLEVVVEGVLEDTLDAKERKETKETKEREIKEREDKRQASDAVLLEIEENKDKLMIGFDCSNQSDDFQKYYNVALGFLNQFRKTIQDSGGSVVSINNSKIGTWVKSIRDMYVLDKINGSNIKLVYDNLPKDDFWSKNILSTAKLRKQFNVLVVKYAVDKKASINNSKAIY